MRECISSDTNIWIDLAHIDAVSLPFQLKCTFVMFQETFDAELLRPEWLKKCLLDSGIEIIELEIGEFYLAQDYAATYHHLSIHDCTALAIAKHRQITLMTGDKNLRKAAIHENIQVIGIIGIIDRLLKELCISKEQYIDLLIKLRNHPDSRLPQKELDRRIELYSNR